MWVSEHLVPSPQQYKILSKPEFFIPLTWHFHLFEKKSETEYVAFLYPYETTENVKVGEVLQKYILHVSSSSDGINYSLEEQKGRIKYSFIISMVNKSVNIMVGVEKKGFLTSIPIEPRHLLDHVITSLKSM